MIDDFININGTSNTHGTFNMYRHYKTFGSLV